MNEEESSIRDLRPSDDSARASSIHQRADGWNGTQAIVYHGKRWIYIATLIALVFVLIYSVPHLIQKVLERSNQQTAKQISMTKQDLTSSFKSEFKQIMNQIQHNIEDPLKAELVSSKEEIKKLEIAQEKLKKTIQSNQAAIEIGIQEMQNHLESMQAKQREETSKESEKINKKFDSLFSLEISSKNQKKRERQLYNDLELSEKQKYEQKMLAFLDKHNERFIGMLGLHKYNFRLNDTAFDTEPHRQENFMANFMTKEDEPEVCVIVPNYLEVSHYILEYSLNSIFRQTYSNYRVVLFSHPSAATSTFLQNYLRLNNISESNYLFMQTAANRTALENIYNAVHTHCSKDSIAFIIEGGSSLLGKKVFRTFGYAYTHNLYAVLFSNHFKVNLKDEFADWGGTIAPSSKQIQNRDLSSNIYYQLLSFRTEVFRQINVSDFKDDLGRFFDVFTLPILAPLLQLSCGLYKKISGVHYMQLTETQDRIEKEKAVLGMLKTRKNYSCSPDLQRKKDALIHNHPVLDYISESRKQAGGIMVTPNGSLRVVDPHFTKDGKSIADVLYPTKREKKERIIFHQGRIDFIKGKKEEGIQLIKHNLKLDRSQDALEDKEEQAEYDQLDKLYNMSSYTEQLPFCIVVCSYNNNANQRIEYNLNSIFRQNYSNYFAVIINDLSNDGTDTLYRKYFDFYNIPKDKYVYIENHRHKTAMENIYDAELNFCSEDSVTLIVDGDDELIGRNVIKLFNANYLRLKAGYLYSNYYYFDHPAQIITKGISIDHSLQEKEKLLFRKAPIKNSHTRTWKTALFRKVDKSNFQDANQQFLTMTCDFAIAISVMEKACGRVYNIPVINYLYNGWTGINDWQINEPLQQSIVEVIRGRKTLDCDPSYKGIPLFPKV